MKRVVPVSLVVAGVAMACVDRSPLGPGEPSLAISDGTQTGPNANPDFFFLPPMVRDPSGHENFDEGEFNPNLEPEVQICEGTAEPFHTRCVDNQVALFTMAGGTDGEVIRVSESDEHYHVNWHTDRFALVVDRVYRVRVFVGSKELGFADVVVVLNGKGLRNINSDEFVGLVDDRTLPIKFRIENGALCEPPGTKPCVSETIDLSEASSVQFTEEEEVVALIDVPAQGDGSTTVTMQFCTDLHPRATDLTTVGDCVEMTADPPLTDLTNPATASLCRVPTEDRDPLVTIVQFEQDENRLIALPDAESTCPETVGSSLLRRWEKYARARWRAVRERLAGLFRPAPLFAALCDRGCGGETDGFESSFQGVVPSKMDYDDPADADRTVVAGTLLPLRVLVTNAENQPVEGARVNFEILEGGVGSLSAPWVETGADGIAEVILDVGIGSTVVRASGRGIADPSYCIPNEAEECVPQVFAPDHALGGAAEPVVVGNGALDFAVESRVIFAASGQGTCCGPSDLYLVETFATGSDLLIGRLRTATGAEPVITDIARSPTTRELFGISFTTLYRIDASTAMLTQVGSGLGISNANALAFDASGTLFGVTSGGSFFTVNTETGVATTLGSLGEGLGSQGDIAFAPDGTLFGTAAGGEVGSVLVEIDPVDGSAEIVGAIGFNNVFGLAFLGSQLYGLTARDARLITIDQGTGAGTAVRSLSFDAFGASSARAEPGRD
jgi:hypothetical protein